MKLLLALCLGICIVGVYCDDAKVPKVIERIKNNPHVMECIDETKVDQNILNELLENYKLPEVPELKCFFGCLMRRTGFLNDDGTYTDKYTHDPDCKANGLTDFCEIGYDTVKCLLEKDLAAIQ